MRPCHHTFLIVFSFLIPSLYPQQSTTAASGKNDSRDDDREANDTEITILINSSFMIIEDLEVNNATDLDRVAERSLGVKQRGFRKLGPTTCRKFSVSEKYRMLEGIGGRNQLYMAETPDEASRGFVQSSVSPLLKAKAFSDNVDETDSPNFCSEECEMIKKALEDALEERRHKKPLSRVPTDLFVPFQDPGPMEVDEGLGMRNRGCALETFVPLGNCSEPGDEVSWAHEQLCSMCRGIYMLAENCFPTFFNSVLCNQQETGCIFDNFSDRAHGICRSETLSLRVLRNRGDTECEDWVIEHIELPVACQCLLSRESWLRSQPRKEL